MIVDRQPGNNSPSPYPLPPLGGEEKGEGGCFIRKLLVRFFSLFFLLLSAKLAFAVVEPGLTNVLGNPSFEEALGVSIGSGVGGLDPDSSERKVFKFGNWDNTPGRGISRGAAPAVPTALDGSSVLILDETPFVAGGAGIFTFQSVAAGEGDFVSFSVFARVDINGGAGDGTPGIKIEFQDANGVDVVADTTQAIPQTTAAFTQFTVSATAPAGTKQAVFTIELTGVSEADLGPVGETLAVFDRAVGTITKFPIVLDTSASKPQVTKGSATFISSRVKNVSNITMNGLDLVITVPEGFHFIDSASRLEGVPVNVRNGSKIINVGNILSGQSKQLGFLLVASNAVQIGKRYEVSFFVRDSTGVVRSATKSLILTVTADPLFDLGVIVGKVFDDRNENQIQDDGETGVPGVKLATEEGIVVITDRHGRFHIPAIKPGRHIVKIDGHTLPQGAKFVTEESLLLKTTEGMFHVANFAVKMPGAQIPQNYQDQLNVLITQGNDVIPPKLAISMEPSVLRMGIGVFEKDPRFGISTNYAELVSGWKIEIRDEFGEEVWTGYGLGSPPAEAPWNGKTKSRESIGSGLYSYRLIVRDREGREDWTPMGYFRVVSKLDKHIPDEPEINVPAVGNMAIERDGKRGIPMSAKPKIEVRGATVPWNEVTVNGDPVGVNLDGSFQTELFVPPGKHSVVVTTTDPEGNSVSYQEEIEAKDSYFFMVGLGEEELGISKFSGNLEAVGRGDRFEDGFYEDGRLAFYLKAKIKGKFLVTSRYDTDDERNELFRNLDPDQYYPVYGDDSQIQYDAFDTKQRFYILVEMDRSYIKWGSYHTNFTGTELAAHNRTFSGLKVHHETLSATRYGDPKRGFTAYTASVDQLADHNEFAGTGGSLFYLRNKNVISGSDKLRIEVRDKIQGITVYSRDLVYGTDYEIDYPDGRVILRKPLSAVSYSDTIITNDILNGSETYLIVDYEFDPQGFVEDRNSGLRGFMHVGDHLRIGGTAIEDRRPGLDYDLRGVDATLKLGRNTKVTAEYAKSQERTIRNAVSFNGGLTFADLPTGAKVIKKSTSRFDDAYAIKAQTKFKTGTEVSGYSQQVNAGFSSADSIRQAGTRKAGLEVRQKAGEHVQMSYRFDAQKATDPANTAGVFVISPEEQHVHTAQIKADYDEYLLVGEYRNQNISPYSASLRGLDTALDDVAFQNAAAVKAGYRFSEDLMPYLKGQVSWSGISGPNHQAGAGVEATVLNGKGTVRIEEMAGNIGDSTLLGFEVKTSETTNVYSHFKTGPAADGEDRHVTTTLGSSTQVNSKSRFYSEREFSSYRQGERLANILGYDTKLGDRWSAGFSFERSMLNDIDAINSHRNAGALEVRYVDRDVLKIISRYELRYGGGTDNRLQWFFRDTLDWKVNEDWRYSLRFNRSDTNKLGNHAFATDASFTELNTGFAYRPVRHNRLNVITRYTWLEEVGAEAQFDTPDIFGIETKETSHIFGVEFGYEVLPPYLGLVEKFAYRRASLEAEGDAFYIGNFLWVNRLNFHVTRKWDLVLEYRLLWDVELLEAMKHGVLVELDREIMDYVRIGLGYNFTDFDDDLRSLNDFTHHGFFTRLTGKF